MTLAAGSLVYLVGFMGSGKTEVARSLAHELGWTFEDTDSWVERREGRTIESIFAHDGEAAFRRLEAEALEEISRLQERVVATGGGLFAQVASRRRIKQTGRSVWLDVPLRVIGERLGSGCGRPLWHGAGPLERRALFERRRVVYALADLRLDAGRGSARRLARAIQERLRRYNR